MNWTDVGGITLGVVVLGLAIASACGREIKKAHADGRPDLTCAPISVGDRPGERCENEEVICYTPTPTLSLSCIRKNP